MKHLYDVEAASNILLEMGLYFQKENYVAQSWNISKFTNNKYNTWKNALPIIDKEI